MRPESPALRASETTPLPCPFCGSDAVEETIVDANEGVAYTPWYRAGCHRCDFWLQGARESGEAVAAWNRRAVSAPRVPEETPRPFKSCAHCPFDFCERDAKCAAIPEWADRDTWQRLRGSTLDTSADSLAAELRRFANYYSTSETPLTPSEHECRVMRAAAERIERSIPGNPAVLPTADAPTAEPTLDRLQLALDGAIDRGGIASELLDALCWLNARLPSLIAADADRQRLQDAVNEFHEADLVDVVRELRAENAELRQTVAWALEVERVDEHLRWRKNDAARSPEGEP